MPDAELQHINPLQVCCLVGLRTRMTRCLVPHHIACPGATLFQVLGQSSGSAACVVAAYMYFRHQPLSLAAIIHMQDQCMVLLRHCSIAVSQIM